MTQDYSNKNILLTGAASGIGFSQLEAYLAAGAIVYAVDRQDIAYQHINLKTFKLDISQHKQLKVWLETLTQSVSFDILLNTAGVLDDYKTSLDTTLDDWQHVLDINLTPMFILTNAVLPAMLSRGYGHIINMASIAGFSAGGGGVAYTSAKHAIVGYTKQLAFDYAAKGLHVNAIAPGAIKTPMNAADFAGDAEMAKQVAAQTPAKRWANPDEVAQLSLYLTSQQADYINGTVIPIDGGWTLGH
ncbi:MULTISPECIES: 3-oxoacyl-ACP reductase [Leuconostoc]|jgi:3-oxoacyl-[acyl-carrier protein] reductase|uniref:NAD(P)-dependent dehydrogenase n=1 Tax=Leuconostoc citreum TaxID=33964 RepID=A0A5A5U158_LEUCI|nr:MULTISPECIES: 3-oxoacyl-ACP reductase [Leuconostoc]KAF0261364.1 3-oxoacyl-ACP reductase [Leuconostoc citreum]MBA5938479.1 3-oxoacyl-ACP reductase [Leuconostoc citreum]MBE4726676.1 3-oxoacyl-ACP reductase [Leuconostoc citreum]MBU7450297.1 3-oxoacyl-ACP reductase [Leuconostoc citreum]MCJ2167816.1 3-oxoacyl-ACP reductase [Leuconostoc citreum]